MTLNYLSNGTFESGIWATVIGADTATQSNERKTSGHYSLRIAPAGATAGRSISVTGLTALTNYVLHGWIYLQSFSAGRLNLDVTAAGLDTSGIQITSANQAANLGGWHYWAQAFTTPSGVTSVTLRFFGDNTPTFVAHLDDVWIVTAARYLEHRVLCDFDDDGDFEDDIEDLTPYCMAREFITGANRASSISSKAYPGEFAGTFKNQDGRFNKLNASSPLYGLLNFGHRLQVVELGVPQWTGRMFPPKVEARLSGERIATIRGIGFDNDLASYKPPPLVRANGETTGALMRSLLDGAGVGYDSVDIDEGILTTGPLVLAEDDYALDKVHAIEEVEIGWLRETPEGPPMAFAFDQRDARVGAVARATFSDDPSDVLYYEEIDHDGDPYEVVNRVEAGISPWSPGVEAVLQTMPGPYVLGPDQTANLKASYPGPVAQWTGHERQISTQPTAPAQVLGTTTTEFAAMTNDHAVSIPATAAGEQCFLFAVFIGTGQFFTPIVLTPAGWSQVANVTFNPQGSQNRPTSRAVCLRRAGPFSAGTVNLQTEGAGGTRGVAHVQRVSGYFSASAYSVQTGSDASGNTTIQFAKSPVPWGPSFNLFLVGGFKSGTGTPIGNGGLDGFTEGMAGASTSGVVGYKQTTAAEYSGTILYSDFTPDAFIVVAIRPFSVAPTTVVESSPQGDDPNFTIGYDAAIGGGQQVQENVKVRGIPMLKSEENTLVMNESASQDPTTGVNVRTHRTRLDLFATIQDAEKYGTLRLLRHGLGRLSGARIIYQGNRNIAHKEAAALLRTSDAITLKSDLKTGFGIEAPFFIETIINRRAARPATQQMTYLLSPAAGGGYFIIGESLIDGADVIAAFA